jgi:hypothetical protein
MTRLCEMIMECRAIGIDDRVVLYGWASQLEEGNDTLYCSKETVAEFLGITARTIQRRNKNLTKMGLLVNTGEQKLWTTGWTPVYVINVPMIVGLCETQDKLSRGGDNLSPRQNVLQGSRFNGFSSSFSSSLCGGTSTATGVPPVQVVDPPEKAGKPKDENLKPRTIEPKPEPKPTQPTPIAKYQPHPKRVCRDCGEPLLRGVNHLLSCSKALGLPPTQMGEADRQKRGESIAVEGKTPPTATPDVAHRSQDPPARLRQKCAGCGQWERADCTCANEWCYAYEPPKSERKPFPPPAGLKQPTPLAAYLDDGLSEY